MPKTGSNRSGTPQQTGPSPCQICGNSGPSKFAFRDGYQLYQCTACNFIYVDPMPSPNAFNMIYNDAYKGTTEGYFIKAKKKLARSRRQLARIRRKVAGRRFLDIGCNGGFAVEAAREYGFDAIGIELDAVSLEYARTHFPDNDYFHGRVEEYSGTSSFDIIYCSEVIEHVPDANSFVSAMAQLMNPRALLYLTTPDISHWRRPKNIHEWDAFCPPAHCLYFNPTNLTSLLAQHGIQVIQKRWAWKPGIRLYARRNA